MSPISRDDPQDSMINEHLDCTGRKRLFRLSLYTNDNFLDAIELRDGEPTGWRFVLPVEPNRDPHWGEMGGPDAVDS